jgi:hypothetical protein
MSNHAKNPNPEGTNAIWKAVHKLREDFENLSRTINEPTFWSKIWDERTWLIPAALALFGVIGTSTWYVGGLILDKHIQEALAPVQSDIEGLRTDILTMRLLAAAKTPTDKASQVEAAKVLADARKISIKLSAETVEQAAQSFIRAADTDPDAWKTAGDFLNYRTFLNVGSAPALPNTQALPGRFRVEFDGIRLSEATERNLGLVFSPTEEIVPGSQSALFIRIGHENEVGSAPKHFMLDAKGWAIILDGYHIRNVVVHDARIIYSGGPLILENVYFVNCTFDLKNEPNSKQFAEDLIMKVPVSFTAS